MTLHRTRAVYMRGGTSRALMFRVEDLPADPAARDALFLSAMGVPDPFGRNLDGMGGGLSSLNKVCLVGPASRADADVDYTFVQLTPNTSKVDYSGNCGNMSSAIGPFAVEEGLVPCPPDGEAVVRVHNTNTGKIIVARFPVEGGALADHGDLAIDGVAGTAAPIRLEFLAPGGAKTGRLLPTGNAIDRLDVPGIGPVDMSCVDAANPCVFVRAEALGKMGSELPTDLDHDTAFLAAMEAIRTAAATAMGLPQVPSIPKVAMLASPLPFRGGVGGGACAARDMPHPNPSPEGEGLAEFAHDIAIRMISVGQPHRAVPITGAVCLAVAARTPGTIAWELCRSKDGPIRIGHASGTLMVDASVDTAGDEPHAVLGAVYRTARRLFEGNVIWRA